MKIGTEVCRYCGAKPIDLKHIVNRLIKAEIANALMHEGSQPDDYKDIEQRLTEARREWRVALEAIS